MSVITQGLTKRYGDRVAVDGLDLHIREGELFALLGPNGSGKTTTIEMLEGFRRADSGTIRVLGFDPVREARKLRSQMGLMLQDGGLYQQMRVGELARLFAAYYPRPADPEDLIEQLGLGSLRSQKVRNLSGGERQRLSLLTALVGNPRVLFLDEPTSGMDPQMRAETWQRLTAMRADGVTILFTTHLTDEAERYSDRVGLIFAGTLQRVATPAELIQGMPLTFTTDKPLDLEAMRSKTIELVEISARRYRTQEPHSEDLLAQIQQEMRAQGASIIESKAGSLEDLMRLLGGEGP